MADKPKITITFKSDALESEIEAAFLATHIMPSNTEGQALYTPAQFVKVNIKNYIKGVLNQYRKEQAMQALNFQQVDDIE